MKNILKTLLIVAAITLVVACGGGGGGGGTPNGPSATLRVYPPVDTISLPVGASGLLVLKCVEAKGLMVLSAPMLL